MIEKERVAVDPLTLFLRLVVFVDRKPEVKIENCLYHELIPYPTALFKDDEMRTTKNKSALKHFLLEGVKPVKTQIAKLSLMKALCCSHATGQKDKSSAKYSKCT